MVWWYITSSHFVCNQASGGEVASTDRCTTKVISIHLLATIALVGETITSHMFVIIADGANQTEY